MSNFHAKLASMGAAPVVQMRRVSPAALASVDSGEPKTIEDAERALIRASAELETFALVREMFDERLEIGTITQDEYDEWSVRHDRAHVTVAARCRRIQVWHDGLVRQRERQLMHDSASMGTAQLRAELERAKRAVLTQRHQLASQGRRLQLQADHITNLLAADSDSATANRKRLLQQVARSRYEALFLVRESAARGESIPPLLEAFAESIKKDDHRHLSYAEFVENDAAGFLAHLERVRQTLAALRETPAGEGER